MRHAQCLVHLPIHIPRLAPPTWDLDCAGGVQGPARFALCIVLGSQAMDICTCSMHLNLELLKQTHWSAMLKSQAQSCCKAAGRLTCPRQCKSCRGGGRRVRRSAIASGWSISGRRPPHAMTSRRLTMDGRLAPRAPDLLPLQSNMPRQHQNDQPGHRPPSVVKGIKMTSILSASTSLALTKSAMDISTSTNASKLLTEYMWGTLFNVV